ncbi:MAG: N-acetylmuramoyl-L-alanine amidase [Terriglobales bacterium]
MPWIKPRRPVRAAGAFAAAIFLASTLLLYSAPEEKRITIYSNAANYSLPVLDRDGDEYVGLLEVFEPLGAVSARANGNHWKFRYYDVESEFTAGKTRARVHGSDYDLPSNFLLENGRGLVPLSCLGTLMPRILGGPVTFNQNSRRLFVGNVAVHFTAQVSKTTPPKLVMNFTAPVNPTIATSPGELRMAFSHEAVVAPGSQALTFDSKIIPSASFQESNGAAAIVVAATAPLMASFANNGRTVIIEPVPRPTVPPQAATPVPRPPTSTGTAAPTAGTAPVGIRHYFAVVDPSHGGDERGASLSDQLAEKDVTLAFGRRLRQELETRGLATLLLRDSDTTLSLDQRASLTNSAHPAIYICIHAASQGEGIRVYSALVPSQAENRGPFLSWDAAQAAFQLASRSAEYNLVRDLQNKQIPARSLIAALRPLNNITTTAIAVEIAPPSDDVSQLNSPAYQQLIASAVAAGVADFRDKLEAGR